MLVCRLRFPNTVVQASFVSSLGFLQVARRTCSQVPGGCRSARRMAGVDGAIEQFQIHASKLFAQAEDAVTGAAGAILMPFIKPADSFVPEGDGLDSEDEEEARQCKTCKCIEESRSRCRWDKCRNELPCIGRLGCWLCALTM